MNAYRISTGKRLEKGDALSARRNGQWQRAFFQRIIDTSTLENVFDGDLVIIFEGRADETYVRPNATYDIMVRGA